AECRESPSGRGFTDLEKGKAMTAVNARVARPRAKMIPRHTITEEHLAIARRLAARFSREWRGIPFDEFHSEALAALADAACKWNREANAFFDPYAIVTIQWQLLNFAKRWRRGEARQFATFEDGEQIEPADPFSSDGMKELEDLDECRELLDRLPDRLA